MRPGVAPTVSKGCSHKFLILLAQCGFVSDLSLSIFYLNFHVAEIEGGTSTIPLVLLQGTRILDAV
jgi:hypothetical protein